MREKDHAIQYQELSNMYVLRVSQARPFPFYSLAWPDPTRKGGSRLVHCLTQIFFCAASTWTVSHRRRGTEKVWLVRQYTNTALKKVGVTRYILQTYFFGAGASAILEYSFWSLDAVSNWSKLDCSSVNFDRRKGVRLEMRLQSRNIS